MVFCPLYLPKKFQICVHLLCIASLIEYALLKMVTIDLFYGRWQYFLIYGVTQRDITPNPYKYVNKSDNNFDFN